MTEPANKIVKGHWPKGKRRNPEAGTWSRTLLELRSLIDDHWTRGSITYAALAVDLSVDKKTVTRWRDGIDRPPVSTQRIVSQWVRAKRKLVADVGA